MVLRIRCNRQLSGPIVRSDADFRAELPIHAVDHAQNGVRVLWLL